MRNSILNRRDPIIAVALVVLGDLALVSYAVPRDNMTAVLLGLVGLAVTVGVLLYPIFGILIGVFLSSSQAASFYFVSDDLLSRAFLVVMLITISGFALQLLRGRERLVRDKWTYLAILLPVLVATITASSLDFRAEAMATLASIVKGAAFCLLIVSLGTTIRRISALMLCMVAGVAWSAITGIQQTISAGSFWAQVVTNDLYRATGMLRDTNAFAVHLVFVLPLLLALIFSTKIWIWKLLGFATAGVLLLALAGTLSRTGAIGLSVALIVALLLLGPRRIHWTWIGLGLAVGVLMMSTPGTLLATRFSFLTDPYSDTPGRIDVWLNAVNLALQSPWFGFGTPNVVFSPFGPTSPHNMFLQVFVAFGIGGVISLITVLTLVVKRLAESIRSGDGSEVSFAIAVGLVSAWAGHIAALLFIDQAFTYLNWVAIALALVVSDVSSKESSMRD